MGATFKALLHPTPRKDGTQQIRIRVTVNRVARFWDQDRSVLAKDWNAEASLEKPQWLRKGHLDASYFNPVLRDRIRAGQVVAENNPTWSAERIIYELENPGGKPAETCVVDFLVTFIPSHTASLSIRTGESWWRLHRVIRAWRMGQPWPLSEFTPTALQELYTYILTRPHGGKVGSAQRMRQLSTVARRLVDDGKIEHHQNPFLKIKFKPPASKAGRVLTLEEQAALLSVPLPKGVRGRHMQLARDVFQTQFLLWGSRIGDVLELTWGQVSGGEVVVQERKTGKEKVVEILPLLAQVLGRYYPKTREPDPTEYVFPVLERHDTRIQHAVNGGDTALMRSISRGTKRINGYLRNLADLCQVKPFTSHTARHSFATSAEATLGNVREIQRLLNHSSPRITETYLARLNKRAVQGAGTRVLEAWNIRTTDEQQKQLLDKQ